jgi:site-specific recombinase XerD
LKAFGDWCVAEELAAAPGFRALRRPDVPRRLIAPFSDAELRSLLALADERERALVLLLFDTGLRLSELVSLRVGDMRPDGTLHVLGKGAKERIVPLGTTARRALVRYLGTRARTSAADPAIQGPAGCAQPARRPAGDRPARPAGGRRDPLLASKVESLLASQLPHG